MRVLLSLLLPFIAFVLVWFFIGGDAGRDKLLRTGIHVPGRLIGVEETGTLINRAPQLALTMAFTRRDGRLDTAKTRFVPKVRYLSLFQQGAEIEVAYDSTDPHNATFVELKTGGAAIPGGASGGIVDSLRHVADSLKGELEKKR